jgi:hypothetical protein
MSVARNSEEMTKNVKTNSTWTQNSIHEQNELELPLRLSAGVAQLQWKQ